MPVSPEYLIQDPFHEYGIGFIEHIYRTYGYRAICFYSNRTERTANEARFPQLRPPFVSASYDVNLDRLDEFVQLLKSRHSAIGVIPFNETSLVPASYLSSSLNLGWASETIIGRFRNKWALKEHLRSSSPGLRVNASALVGNTAEVLSIGHEPQYERFVLKPNDGFGNQAIGVFDRSTPAASIDSYFRDVRGRQVVMEEYIGGTEYFANGQIDSRGNIYTIAIFEYRRGAANGRHNLDMETLRLPYGTNLFAQLTEYTESVLRATGLTCSPFHLELKVDERGACLIEVAARLAGHGNATVSGFLHGPQLDVIEVASRHYLRPTETEAPKLNWNNYNSHAVRYVHGIAPKRERIYDVRGIAEVEALPEFYQWVRKPEIGERWERTEDCLSMPWSVILKSPSEARAAAAAREVRQHIRWNCDSGLATRILFSLKLIAVRGPAKLLRMTRLTAMAELARALVPGSLRRRRSIL